MQLQSQAQKFEKNLRDFDDVIGSLITNNVISFDEMDKIKAIETKDEKNAKLYQLICNSDYNRLMIFRDILNNTRNEVLAKTIDDLFDVAQDDIESASGLHSHVQSK